MQQNYNLHYDFHTVTVAIGGLTTVAMHLVGPFVPLGQAYYFWVLGGNAKEASEKKKDKAKIDKYNKTFTKLKKILKNNTNTEYEEIKGDLANLLKLNTDDEEEYIDTWKAYSEFGQTYNDQINKILDDDSKTQPFQSDAVVAAEHAKDDAAQEILSRDDKLNPTELQAKFKGDTSMENLYKLIQKVDILESHGKSNEDIL